MPSYVYINGYPGVGKLTIAKELEKQIPGSKVYDNHLMIDGIAPMVGRSSPHYQELRRMARQFYLGIISTHEATDGATWIFTDSRELSADGSAAAQDYRDAAANRSIPFVSVVLHCDTEENEKRLVGKGRGADANTKLTDPVILRDIRQNEDLHRFGGESELELDVTNLQPSAAAKAIREHVERVTAQSDAQS